ncbi:MAG: hypothetical protein SGJ24_01630 [Chloroflexota bacterium]|nr:hypothetical protein [Chloroflexota bacterium]
MLKLPQRDFAATLPLKPGTIQLSDTTYITPKEWRWLITVSSLLALLVFAPLMWVALRGTENWQFMGALHNYRDGATYLSKIELGYSGSWLVYFQHTPEDHAGAFIQVLYLALGHLARVISVSPLIAFHVARLGAALIMYIALYQFAAVMWSRIRTRRTFFVIASIGSGFGWLLAPLLQTETFPDFALLPEAYSFFSTLVNVHFPLTFAVLALLAAMLILALRPGLTATTSIFIYPSIIIFSLLLALLYPQALVPIAAALTAYTALLFWRRHPGALYSLRLLLTLTLPALPFAAYYALTVRYNPMMAAWNAQNLTPPPSLPVMLLGFGLPLLLAIPAIFRAARRFELDGDRLLLLWIAAILVAVYLPTTTGRRYAVGMIIPIAYFATRAIEDVWLRYVARRWRTFIFVLVSMVIAISPMIMLFLPIVSALVGYPQAAVGIFLERDYAVAFGWLRDRTDAADVVLASPVVSTWIPGWVGSRVVAGHPYETLNAVEKEASVRAWYAGTAECSALIAPFNIKYVIVGPQERAIGTTACIDTMRVAAVIDDVTIYTPILPTAP